MTAGHGAKRPQRQDAAIAALLTEPTLEAAAKRAGVSESSLLRWLRDPPFRAEYRDARRAVVEQAVSGLQHATSEAVATLRRNLTCGAPSAEIAAAKAILDQSFRGLEVLDHAEQIAAIKRHLGLTVAPDEPSEVV
jgi:hypothetical protein